MPLTTRTLFSALFACLACVQLGCGRGEDQAAPPAPSAPVVDQSAQTGRNANDGPDASKSKAADGEAATAAPLSVEQLARQREELDQSVWKNEQLAQEHEKTIVDLWDRLLTEQNKPDGGDPFAVFASVPLEAFILGKPTPAHTYDHDIQQASLSTDAKALSRQDCAALLAQLKAQGHRIVMTEWHHATFDQLPVGGSRSTWNMAIYIVHQPSSTRYVLGGPLMVEWAAQRDAKGLPVPTKVDASKLSLWSRQGPPAFERVATIDPSKMQGKPTGAQPVLLYDLDGDGRSEIVLGYSNVQLRHKGDFKFETSDFLRLPATAFETGLLADFTGDGVPDYLAPSRNGNLLLYEGSRDAAGPTQFNARPIGHSDNPGPFVQPQALTAGDIDGDGDLDVFVGQYRISYVGGQMPAPYYDANDGFPAYLLINDGKGRFKDVTEEAGLQKKRHRRSYSAALVDLDDDRDLDLLVVSDFAGIDVYANDGKGKFADITDRIIKGDPKLFGMSACFGDFNLDGMLDFYIAGMSSTTARRLDHMKLGRQDAPDVHAMRGRMGYGNRMYVANEKGFDEPTFKDQVARTGWTWGTTMLDFDNDGDADIFVSNGHSSGQSTKDHCSHFWCHDIYVNDSKPNKARDTLFKDVLGGYLDKKESWDGYQKKVLLMNGQGKSFVNVGFLMGVGDEYDGRAGLSDDLDGDGRMDLVVVEDNWKYGQKLHVYRNQLATKNHWIGLRFVEAKGRPSPIGAQVTATTASGRKIARIMTGESVFGQHAFAAHFGLGGDDAVAAVDIQWPDGTTTRLEKPAVDRWHPVVGKQ